MNGRGKSDRLIVPTKLPNNAGEPVAEVVEGRGRRKGNVTSKSHPGHSAGQGASRALVHVRRAGLRPDPAPDPSEEPSVVVPHAGICAGGHPKGWSLPRPHLLAELLSVEISLRDTRRSARLLAEAKVPRTKLLAQFDLGSSAMSQDTLAWLARGDFVESATSVVLIGGPGTGKTHLLIGTLIALAGMGRRVRYVNASALVNELAEAEDERKLSRLLERYARYDVLAIDELGYLHLDRRGAELLFQVITDREESSSLMVATNLPFGEWASIFTDARLAAAVVDRITYRSKIIATGIESYRLRSTTNAT